MALFCVAIKRDSVSLLRCPFLCHFMWNFLVLSLEVSIQLFFSSLYMFFKPRVIGGFQSILSDTKSPLLSRTFQSILANLRNDMVWTVMMLSWISCLFQFLWDCSKDSVRRGNISNDNRDNKLVNSQWLGSNTKSIKIIQSCSAINPCLVPMNFFF